MPNKLSCPGPLTLSATTSDPDGDVADVRWYLEEKLIESSVTSIDFTQNATVRAVATDARGAATSAEKAISCL